MRVLFDIVHPAHVHFYRHLHRRLIDEGNEVRILARDKDVTLALLDAFGMEHEVHGSPSPGVARQARELVGRDAQLLRMAREMRPDLILARNPAGMHVGRLTGAIGVFDTDNGTSAGVHFRMARPFAHVITTPACLTEDFGAKHRRYPSYKPLAFLHPDHFTPDPGVRDELGLAPDEEFAIVRLVAMDASHDRRESGVDPTTLDSLLGALSSRMRVFLSSEQAIPAHLQHLAMPTGADRMHDALAAASLIVGDSGSMAVEGAVLGTPNIFYGTFAGRLDYLNDLENRFDLARSFRPEQSAALLREVERLLEPGTKESWSERRKHMLEEMVDLSQWYYELVQELAG